MLLKFARHLARSISRCFLPLRRIRLMLSCACLAAVSASIQPGMAADTTLKSDIDDYYDEHLSELFLWFHQNPELGFLEQQTAARLASELRALGIDVTEGVGGTGLVGMIENGARAFGVGACRYGWLAYPGRERAQLCLAQ